MTGDLALRKAAKEENVKYIGTIGVLDRLLKEKLITNSEYNNCLEELIKNNGKKVRLPAKELEERIKKLKINS